LKAIYTTCILNVSFPVTSGQDQYLREVQLLDKHTGEVFFDKLTFIYLEMPRFKKREDELLPASTSGSTYSGTWTSCTTSPTRCARSDSKRYSPKQK
jgi:hypothetical protein